MSIEINQVIASGEVSKSQVVNTENMMTLSSPHFDEDDSQFTDLLVKDRSFKEVVESGESSPLVLVFDNDRLESIQVQGVQIPRLDIKSIFVEGDTLLIEKSNGEAVRVVNSEISEDLIQRVARDVRVFVKNESLTVLRSRWEMI